MVSDFDNFGLKEPEFKLESGSFIHVLRRKVEAEEVTPEVTPDVFLINTIAGEMTRQELQDALKLKDSEHFRKRYLLPALEAGLIEMTIPDKPTSSKQRYRLTEKGQMMRSRDK